MKKIILALSLVATLNAGALFKAGQKNFGFSAGSSSGFGNTYTVIGANFNYFVQDYLSVGAGYQGYFGSDPKINELSIPVTYYYPYSEQYHPYLGARYSHTFIDDPYEDYDIYGFRAGMAMSYGGNSFMSIGWVQDYRVRDGESDSEGYPEISMGFVF